MESQRPRSATARHHDDVRPLDIRLEPSSFGGIDPSLLQEVRHSAEIDRAVRVAAVPLVQHHFPAALAHVVEQHGLHTCDITCRPSTTVRALPVADDILLPLAYYSVWPMMRSAVFTEQVLGQVVARMQGAPPSETDV